MTETVIRAEKLGKLYHIGQQGHGHSLREMLARKISAPFRALATSANGEGRVDRGSSLARCEHHAESIWALRDVSFEVKKGEIVGVIGPNGSGKSTLLKLLSQITEPSEGEIYIKGRVTSLIELGAAFHLELTGRENIYLNGAILGLTKSDVDRKYREIVDFAELWDFMDTPVKHYSSGMTVRLGFAVAISVEPDILLVDEVLAVGDASFRKRCLDRIDAFIRAGRTIIIVTHSFEVIRTLARRAMLIRHGALQADGPTEDVIAKYTQVISG